MKRGTLAFLCSVVFVFGISIAGSEQSGQPGSNGGTGSPAGLQADGRPNVDVKAFIDTWLGAQNEGKFAVYNACYAVGFKGIKRSGSKTFTYERDGWLKDRAKMFVKPMIVEARNATVATRNDFVEVNFIQVWESSGYKDMGPKLLRLVFGKSGYAIVYEEMLESIVLASPKAKAPKALDFAFVFGDNCLVLEQAADSALKAGLAATEPELVSLEGISVAMKMFPDDSIPKRYANLIGEKVSIYDQDGDHTEGVVKSLVLIAAGILHFGTITMYEQMMVSGDSTNADIAAGIWDEIDDWGSFIAAYVEYNRDDITGPIWATNRNPKTIGTCEEADDVPYAGMIGSPDSPLDSRRIRVFAAAGKPGLLVDWQSTGSPCGEEEFIDDTAIYKIEKKGVREFFSYSMIGMPIAVFDFNGNGVPDFIFWKSFDSYIFILDGNLEQQVTIPFHDCPC
jgi:hypothetical protein